MPIQINTSVKGKEYPPYAVTVERGKIKEFARAIGDLSPFYLDDAVAKAGPWGDIIAPPTFPIVIAMRASARAVADPGLNLNYAMVVHGEQRFEYARPISAAVASLTSTKSRASPAPWPS